MRREAETFCREFSRENSLVLPAVLESTGQERCGLQRVREFRPGAHTAAMHTDACKQYCGRPSLRVRLQIFRRLPFLASASRKLRLCRAQVRRAVRLINKAPATPVLLPPKLAQKSNPLRLLRKQVWADLIRSSQIPPPRQPVRRVIKTLAIIGADAAERGSGASQILKDSARYSENCLQRAGRTCGTASSPWPDPDSSPLQTRRCPPHALFSQVSAADQKQIKLRENNKKCSALFFGTLSSYYNFTSSIRLQLRFSYTGPTYSREHELISHFSAGSYPDHRRGRGVTHFLARSLSTALHFAAVSWLANTTEFQTNDSGSRGLKRAGSPGCSAAHVEVLRPMRREAETFIGSSLQRKQPGPSQLFWNQLASSAVVCGASVNLEPALIPRQCTRTPANSTAAAPHYAYSCRSSGVCRSWRQRAVNCAVPGPVCV
ncbi:Hypothetical_protein [Hexamita inflata]|uniref:Hypothetical_protein n=1 Tax=Hexamita inflata TaxID=28002 RepID=A0AA86RDN3_9EUKA|nr:Hypothetical protein HINF_LOCUS62097 [Hexamita inflata]